MAGHYLNFGCGCFRASRRVCESHLPPWFDFGYDATKTQKTGCECRHFARRLETLAIDGRPIAPTQVGVIGRRTELVLVPSGQGRMRIVSPHEVPLGEV
jgi:hypothetical protein